MRIAFVAEAIYPYLKGGKEKRLYELSKRLSDMGHEVDVYTMHWWDEPEKSITTNEGVTLHAISKIHPIYKGDRRNIKEAIMFSVACLKLIKADFDVIDVDQMPFFPVFTTWIVCKIKGRKLYATWHEALRRSDWINYMGPAGNIATVVERLSIRLPHTITVMSDHTLGLIKSELKRNRGLTLIAPGIDTNLIKTTQPTKIKCEVLFVGRLVKDKNVDVLIKAASLLKKRGINLQYAIVGTGPEQNKLQELISINKLEKDVRLIGNLPRQKDIFAYMKTAKVFVLPSVREGFGIVALEALACDTPVVAIDSPANAAMSLIEDKKNGSLVELNSNSIANAIEFWIGQGKLNSYIDNLIEYDWNNSAKKQVEVYAD